MLIVDVLKKEIASIEEYIISQLTKHRIYLKENYTWTNSSDTGKNVKHHINGEICALEAILVRLQDLKDYEV